jgi:hypothetical protein
LEGSTVSVANNCSTAECPYTTIAVLLLGFEWTSEELDKCGLLRRDFQRFVGKLREVLIEAGLIEEAL